MLDNDYMLSDYAVASGIDILDITRIEKLYYKYREHLLVRILTSKEQYDLRNCVLNERQLINKLAKRYSAKEAMVKACGCGIGKLSFLDIEIANNQHGAPYIILSQKALNYLHFYNKWHINNISLSLSDEKKYAIAQVVILYRAIKQHES